MATHAVPKTVTLSGSFTTGPSGGLLPAAPTNRIEDFPLPNDYTPLGEKLNLTIISALASPLLIAVLFILVEIFFCYRWKAKTKKMLRAKTPGLDVEGPPIMVDPPEFSGVPAIYELSGSVAELGNGNESSGGWSLGLSSPHSEREGSRNSGAASFDRMRIENGGNLDQVSPASKEKSDSQAPTKLENELAASRELKRKNS